MLDTEKDLIDHCLKLSESELLGLMGKLIRLKSSSLSPEESLHFLFELENKIYTLQGVESIRYGQGLHTKHKHIKYHDFFIDNIEIDNSVLDIGCGNGALTYDIANQVSGVNAAITCQFEPQTKSMG